MPQTKPQSTQVVNDSALSEIGLPARSSVETILQRLSQGMDAPLRLAASFPTPDSKLRIRSNLIQRANGTAVITPPLQSNVQSFVDSSIDFQTGATSGGTINISFPDSNVGKFRRLVLSLLSDGSLSANFSSESAAISGLANAGSLFATNSIPVGYIDLECTSASPGRFKTAGSNSNIIENSVSGTARVVSIAGSGGGSAAATALTYAITAGENLAANTPFYISLGTGVDAARTAGLAYKLDASQAARANFAGFTTSAISSGLSGYGQIAGALTGFSGLSAGQVIYGSLTTPGAYQTSKPTTPGQLIVPLGTVANGTDLLVNAALSASISTVDSTINVWPNYLVASEAELTTAIAACASAGGGVICLINSFSLSSAVMIPSGTLLVGRRGASVITIVSSGTISFATNSGMRDVWMTTSLSSGNLVNLSNNYVTIRDCQFTVPDSSTCVCVYVTGNSNKLYNTVFVGVAGETSLPYGISYASGVNNTDNDSVFLP